MRSGGENLQRDLKDTSAGAPVASSAAIGVPTLSPGEDVLGHFSVPSGKRLLDDIKTHFSTPMVSGFLDDQALRSLAAAQLGSRRDIAFNLNIEAPFGCAVVDFKAYENGPIACTFATTSFA